MVHLKEFSLMSSKIQSTEKFKVIKIAIPATSIEQAIAQSADALGVSLKLKSKRNVIAPYPSGSPVRRDGNRHRRLDSPAQLVVCLIIAMSLWSRDSMRDVLKNLIYGLSKA
jgi:hypothetical protein